jgi:hypothetical protein
MHVLECSLSEQMLDEVTREKRARVAIPEKLHDQFSAEGRILFVRNQK